MCSTAPGPLCEAERRSYRTEIRVLREQVEDLVDENADVERRRARTLENHRLAQRLARLQQRWEDDHPKPLLQTPRR